MAVSKRLRYEVLRRDNHACRYCGATAPDVKLTVDHVVPTALGGSDDPTNLVTACAPCNSGKSASTPDAPLVGDVAADALRWARAMARAAQLDHDAWHEQDSLIWTFEREWNEWQTPEGKPFLELGHEHHQTLRNLHRAGLGYVDLRYATIEAMNARHIPAGRIWRYFAGICWRLVEQRRETASSLIQAEEAGPDGS